MGYFMKVLKQHLFSIFWFSFYIISQFIVVLLGAILFLIFDEDFIQISSTGIGEDIENAISQKIISISYYSIPIVSIIVILIFLIILFARKNIKDVFAPIAIKKIIKYILLALVLNLFLNLIIAFLPVTKYISSLNESIDIALSGSFLYVLLGTGILAPIMEEIIFRYGICYNLSKINRHYGVIVSALIFGLMHGNLIQGTYAALLGTIFGYINQKEKSLLPSIIMHISINSLTVLMAFEKPIYAIVIIAILFALMVIKNKKIST